MKEQYHRGRRSYRPEAKKEAKDLGPYPAWDDWKESLSNHLKKVGYAEDLGDLNSTEHVLHEWYELRRKYQKGEVTTQQFDQERKQFVDNHEVIFDNLAAVEAFKYITDKTTLQLKK